jgi:hypothetical protein
MVRTLHRDYDRTVNFGLILRRQQGMVSQRQRAKIVFGLKALFASTPWTVAGLLQLTWPVHRLRTPHRTSPSGPLFPSPPHTAPTVARGPVGSNHRPSRERICLPRD